MVRNVHERLIAAPPEAVGALLDTLGSAHDRMWPEAPHEPMVLRHPGGAGLAVGAHGGHGAIRYTVESYEPGRRVTFRFSPRLPLVGTHEFFVDPAAGGTLLRHELVARPSGVMRVLWPLVVRSMHDCYAEDALDRTERELGIGPATAHKHSPWSRFLERGLHRRVSATEPILDGLGKAALARVDASDAFRTDLLSGDSTDPIAWTTAVFAAGPRWVRALLRLRDTLVRPFGVRTAGAAPAGTFPLRDSCSTEAVVGVDDVHLDFRVITTVDESARLVTVTTLIQIHSRLGRVYWSVVRHFHPLVVRSLLRGTRHPVGAVSNPMGVGVPAQT